MKIRTNFVSNSSSTSYIIVINNDDRGRCPHCGRTSSRFFDLIHGESVNSYHENEIRTDDSTEILESLRGNLYADIIWLTSSKNGDKIYTKQHIAKLERIISQVELAKQDGKKVVEVSVDYHDESLNDDIKALLKLGVIEILTSDSE